MTHRISIIAALLAASCAPIPQPSRPNIVFLLVDDMGYGDTGVYGNTYHLTPHIDRLAADGMRFTDAYAAAPNCSPTRSSIMTGRWPARTGVTQYLPGNVLPYAKLLQAGLPAGLPLNETVIAEPLQAAGYATAAIGKWHLGGGSFAPENRGFAVSFAGGHWNAHRSMFAPHPFVDVPGSPGGQYLTDRLTSEAERFIEDNKDRPFFLYLPYYAVHTPIEAKADAMAQFEGRVDSSGRNNAAYAAMTAGVDESVGRIVAKLEQAGLTNDTVVFFFSDNGGVPRLAFNGGLRSGKGYLWEGGVREPLIVKWPKSIEAGSTNSTPVSSVDFYPTILEISGVDDVAGHTVDGESLIPLLTQTGGWSRDSLFWHYPHYANSGSTPTGAIRQDDWKLIEFYEDGHAELYNLTDDPSEASDLAEEQPARAAAMRERLAAWRTSIGVVPPLANPYYDPERAIERTGLSYKTQWDPDAPVAVDQP